VIGYATFDLKDLNGSETEEKHGEIFLPPPSSFRRFASPLLSFLKSRRRVSSDKDSDKPKLKLMLRLSTSSAAKNTSNAPDDFANADSKVEICLTVGDIIAIRGSC
jgi:hypothetical protein